MINILQTTDATFSQLENALWVLQNLLSDFKTANLLLEQYSILDQLVQFARQENSNPVSSKIFNHLCDISETFFIHQEIAHNVAKDLIELSFFVFMRSDDEQVPVAPIRSLDSAMKHGSRLTDFLEKFVVSDKTFFDKLIENLS